MAKVYGAYLKHFCASDKAIRMSVEKEVLAGLAAFGDWQLQWLYATLLVPEHGSDELVQASLDLVLSGDRHEVIRALAAIYVGKFGSLPLWRELVEAFAAQGSAYVQTAILFASRYKQPVHRTNLFSRGSGLSELHRHVTEAVQAMTGKPAKGGS